MKLQALPAWKRQWDLVAEVHTVLASSPESPVSGRVERHVMPQNTRQEWMEINTAITMENHSGRTPARKQPHERHNKVANFLLAKTCIGIFRNCLIITPQHASMKNDFG